MHRVTYYMTERQRERLKALADETGLTVSEYIRRFVDEGLEREERKRERKREER